MTDSEQVEIQIETAKSMIAMRDALNKLYKNRQFKVVIEQGYFKDEAARLVMAKSNSALSEENQKFIDNMITGVGALANYFEMIARRGAEMEQVLEDSETAQQEMLVEELN